VPLISPLLWQGTPFQVKEAVLDFVGMHDRWHAALAKQTTTGNIPTYRFDELPRMGDIHQRHHELLWDAFGIPPGTDFSLYDLNQMQGFVLFMQVHSLDHERLRTAAGL
jgi:hypothetical protein